MEALEGRHQCVPTQPRTVQGRSVMFFSFADRSVRITGLATPRAIVLLVVGCADGKWHPAGSTSLFAGLTICQVNFDFLFFSVFQAYELPPRVDFLHSSSG